MRAGQGVRLSYQVTNLTQYALKGLWAAHPLFAARPNMKIMLPEGVRVRVDWSKGFRLGPLCTEHSWPTTLDSSGQVVDLATVGSGALGFADKLYTTRVSEGRCTLYDPESGDFVAFIFSPHEVPYVGLWVNQGGWPLDSEPCFNVALEPCTGYPDRLDIAVVRNEVATVPAKGILRWQLKLQAGRAHDVLAALDSAP